MEVLEPPILVYSAIDEHGNKQHFWKLLKWRKLKDLLTHTTSF